MLCDFRVAVGSLWVGLLWMGSLRVGSLWVGALWVECGEEWLVDGLGAMTIQGEWIAIGDPVNCQRASGMASGAWHGAAMLAKKDGVARFMQEKSLSLLCIVRGRKTIKPE